MFEELHESLKEVSKNRVSELKNEHVGYSSNKCFIFFSTGFYAESEEKLTI